MSTIPAAVASSYPIGQRVNGLDVVDVRMNVLMNQNLELIAITGNLHEAAVPAKHSFSIGTTDAVARTLSDFSGTSVAKQGIVDLGKHKHGYSFYSVGSQSGLAKSGRRLMQDVAVKQVLYPLPDRLVPAYYVSLLGEDIGGGNIQGLLYAVAAHDGSVLSRQNRTADDSFDYRVWAETAGSNTPLDGPEEEYTPHPTGVPGGIPTPGYVTNSIISMEGFNTNPDGMVDPWLPADATETLGNNVDAYADLNAPSGFSAGDYRADTSSANTFDYVYDPTLDPGDNTNQVKASVTQIFYTINWLHDFYYDSGFNESAGNAQNDNFGRGGNDGDVLLAQAQDHSGTNNARMSTPPDGLNPTMFMFIWDGAGDIEVDALGMTLPAAQAAFGPQNFDISGNAMLADDGTGPDVNDACETITNDLTGTIALINRGSCNFTVKAINAQDAGAVGVIIINNQPGGAPGMSGDAPGLTIGVVSLSMTDGQMLVDAYNNNPPVPTTISRTSAVRRDGTIDNGIVAHEWGHYIHHRLTNCGTTQCGGQSEGWGDFMALMTTIREGDDYEAAFAAAGYSTSSPYYGIRRAPYSSNTAFNSLSFRHIQNNATLPTAADHPWRGNGAPNAEVHNAGEIWASILHQGYVGLLLQTTGPNPTTTFDEAKRAMSDYIVGGMILAPTNPTFNEQLAGILATAAAQNQTDYEILAQAFADRGAGSCSQSPDRNSTTLNGVVEDFQLRGAVEIVSATLDDSVDGCDLDGYLDGNETGRLTVTIVNSGDAPLTDTTVSLIATNSNISFAGGGSTNVASVMPRNTAVINFDVTLSDAASGIETTFIEVTASNNDACETTKMANFEFAMNYDRVPTTLDDAEGLVDSWAADGTRQDVWSRTEDFDNAGNNVWHGVDTASPSDTYIISRPIQVSAADNFILDFDHRYSFEGDAATWWDGGVIEVSTDNGNSWEDIDQYASPDYDGTITNQAGNVLADRLAFSGQSPDWPGFTSVSLDLGTALAGQAVLVRYRIGTDPASGDTGWEIDNISVNGVDNQPFFTTGDEDDICNNLPIADAGPDQTVMIGAQVTLDGSNSSDPDGDPLIFSWAQTAGPAVTLSSVLTDMPTFTAPDVADGTVLTFTLTVDDGNAMVSDEVAITVESMVGGPDAGPGPDAGAGPDAGGPGEPDSGCCQTSAQPSMGDFTLALLCMFGIALATRRRRRED